LLEVQEIVFIIYINELIRKNCQINWAISIQWKTLSRRRSIWKSVSRIGYQNQCYCCNKKIRSCTIWKGFLSQESNCQRNRNPKKIQSSQHCSIHWSHYNPTISLHHYRILQRWRSQGIFINQKNGRKRGIVNLILGPRNHVTDCQRF
jgi:hypothetical protein